MCNEYMGTMPGVPHWSCICTRVMVTWGLCQVPHKDHVCEMHTWGLCQMSRIDHVCVMCMRRLCNVFRSIVHHPMPLKWGFSLNLVQADIQQAPGSSSLCPPECWLAQHTLLSSQPSPNPQYNPCEMSTVSLLLESTWALSFRFMQDVAALGLICCLLFHKSQEISFLFPIGFREALPKFQPQV